MISLKIRDNFFSHFNILRQQQQQQSKVHFRFYFHFRAKKTKQLSRVFSFLCNFKSQPASTLIDHLISLRSIFFFISISFIIFDNRNEVTQIERATQKNPLLLTFEVYFLAQKKRRKKMRFLFSTFFWGQIKVATKGTIDQRRLNSFQFSFLRILIGFLFLF